MKVNEIIESVAILMIVGFMLIKIYKADSMIENYVRLEISNKALKADNERLNKLVEGAKPRCDERIAKAIKLEKDKIDAENKVTNVNSGVVTLPTRVQ